MSVSQADYDDLVAKFNNLTVERNDLQASALRFQGEVNALKQLVGSSFSAPPVRSKLIGSTPSKFSGDRKSFVGFIGQVKFHLDVNSGYYQSDKEKVALYVSLLDGQARNWVSQYYVNDPDGVLDCPTKFVEVLTKAYGDPHKETTAGINLKSLRQGSRSISSYASEFKTTTRDLGFNDAALRYHFREGLNDVVKDDLATCHEKPRTLDELIEQASSVDLRRYERRMERKVLSHASNFRSDSHSVQRVTNPPSNPPTSQPMEVDVLTSNGKLTKEERDRRMRLKLCLYCGVSGHRINNCPTKSSRSTVVAAVSLDNAPSSAQSSVSGNSVSVALVSANSYATYTPFPLAIHVDVEISQGNVVHSVSALLDCGAQGDFVHHDLVKNLGLETRRKESPVEARSVDGSLVGLLVDETELSICIGDYMENRVFNIVNIGHHSMILGMPWLTSNDPLVSWSTGEVSFRGDPCLHSYLVDQRVMEIRSVSTVERPIPSQYSDFADVFDPKEADVLPPHRPYDCKIDLVPGAQPSVGAIYNLSEPELRALKEFLDVNLAKKFIRPSTSSMASPIFFVKKKSGELRPVVDYRALNAITIKNRYPLPLIAEILDRLREAKVFSKLDLRGAYNLVRVRAGDEWKTAFRTKYGLFESLVMNFGLQNAPATFQHFVNDIFRDIMDVYLVCYLDDILIYSSSPEEHDRHVRDVLSRLRDNRLYAKLEKCEFGVDQVEFLGYVVSTVGVQMDPKKVAAVVEWSRPTTVKALQRFIGFANFYRRFIGNFSSIAKPLNSLCSPKSGQFLWSAEAEGAFQALKQAFSDAPILMHPDSSKSFVMETDSSGFGLGAVLSQKFDDGRFHPVGYYSRSLTPAERNYDIHDKELLAVKSAFEEWRHLLEGAAFRITVFTDHMNLLHFFKKLPQVLSGRHARWLLFFSRFDFEFVYREGSKNRKPDALSRSVPELPPEFPVVISTLDIPQVSSLSSPFLNELRSALLDDEFGIQLVGAITDSTKFPAVAARDDFLMFRVESGLLFYGERIYVPERLRVAVVQGRHDSPLAGHPGIKRTLELVSRDYWFPRMRSFVSEFVKSCDACKRAKPARHAPYGELVPLPVPPRPWSSVSMDFVVELPLSNGKTCITVFVCRLTKLIHLVASESIPSAEDTAQIFFQHVFRLHGLPDDIVSDRGSQFTSLFWQRLCQLLKVKSNMSTAFHPQTDGQTERMNQSVEQFLRLYVNHQQDDWSDWLFLAEFSYNNSMNSSSDVSPFFANYGFHPRFDVELPSASQVPRAEFRAKSFSDMVGVLRSTLCHAQESMKEYSDRHRSVQPNIEVGDMVWLNTKNLNLGQRKKLGPKRIGPFKVIAKIGSRAFRLELPLAFSRVHPVFHVSLLEPHCENALPGRNPPPPPPPVELDGELEYEVEAILDSRFRRRQLQYLVRWTGYGPESDSWEPASFVSAPDLVTEFHQRYPHKPRS